MSVFKRLFGRARPAVPATGVVGPVRLADASTGFVSVRAGDIVVLTESDLSVETAQALIERAVVGVVNTVPSFSGHFPTHGPQMLVDAGIVVVDESGGAIGDVIRNGERLHLDAGEIRRDGELLATGIALTNERISSHLNEAGSGLVARLDSIAVNASDLIRREKALLLDDAKIPQLDAPLSSRPVVVITDAHDAAGDLKRLRRFIQDNDPTIIGVGAGADLAIKAGFRPDITVGRADDFSQEAVTRSRQIVVAAPDGRVATPERFEKGGSKPLVFASSFDVTDLAILLADANGAEVIVLVGAPADLSTFLEREPVDVGSNLVTRLRAATKLVDAKSVAWFQTQRMGWFVPLFLLVCAAIALTIAVSVTPIGEEWTRGLGDGLSSFFSWIKGLIS